MDNVKKMIERLHPYKAIPTTDDWTPNSISLSGDTLAVSSEGKLRIYNTSSGQLIRKSDFTLHYCTVSPCEKFVALTARDGLKIQVQDLQSGREVISLESAETRFRNSAHLFWEDWFIYSIDKGVLSGVSLLNPEQRFSCDSGVGKRLFLIEHLKRLSDDLLGIIGYDGPGERSDFVAMPVSKLFEHRGQDFMAFALPKNESELAGKIAFCPYDGHRVMMYQDFENEDIDRDEGEYNGFLIRDLDQDTSQGLVPYYARNAQTGASLMVSKRYFALGSVDIIDIFSMSDQRRLQQIPAISDTKTFIPTPLYSFDNHSKQIAVYDGSEIGLWKLK